MAAFNPLIARLSPPPIPSVLAWGAAYDGSRGPKIDLSQAVPGYPPNAEMLAWQAQAAGSGKYAGYGAIEGEQVLRQAYAEHVSAVYGSDIAAGNIHITSGANQAFMCLAMAVAGHGDTVAMTNPYYFNQETTLAMLGIQTTLVDCDPANAFLPEIDGIRAVLEGGVKALVLVTPNNPTGSVYPPALLRETFELCRKNGVWLILDETYRDFLAEDAGAPHDLLSIDGWEDTLALTYSFSKSYCIPGYRLGAITAGAAMVDQVAKVMDNLQICAPRPPQIALAQAIPAFATWRSANRAEIAARAAALREVMSRLPDWGLQTLGAYFAYIRHPFGDMPSELVAEKLAREAGIVCLPGMYFGEGQQNFLRFAFANADAATIRLLEDRLSGFNP